MGTILNAPNLNEEYVEEKKSVKVTIVMFLGWKEQVENPVVMFTVAKLKCQELSSFRKLVLYKPVCQRQPNDTMWMVAA